MASNRATSPIVEDVAELNLKAARAKGVSGSMYNARQRRPDHAQPSVGAAAEAGRRRNSRGLRTAARGRRARFAGRHHARRPGPGPCPALLLRRRHAAHAGVVSPRERAASEMIAFGLGTIGIGNRRPVSFIKDAPWGGQSWPQPPFRRLSGSDASLPEARRLKAGGGQDCPPYNLVRGARGYTVPRTSDCPISSARSS